MRFDGQLARNIAALCLPTLAVVALSVYFYIDKVPEIEKAESNRVREIYRETAVGIRQDPQSYEERNLPKEWKSVGKMTPGKWGFLPLGTNDDVVIWYERDGRARFTTVVSVPETDYRKLFALLGGLILAVLIGMTVFGIRFFVSYMKTRDDFLSATAHDLTTPLVGLRMMIGRDDDEAKRLNERMLLIVGNIKEFLKLGGRRSPDLKAVDLVALCREAYSLFAADYEDSFSGPVVFEPEASGRPCLVFADETLTLQILWNLFGNDLKYAAPDGRVLVRFVREERFVRVEFVDEGQGMTPRQMLRAFDRYYRAKTVLESGKGGFGIGLCTSREFARAMGGDLAVRSNSPKGCVFSLVLPRFDREIYVSS